MKKLVPLFLTFTLTFCLMGCEKTGQTGSVYCHNCSESSLPENSQFCLVCGSNMLSNVDYDNLIPDYSDFGFENTYGMKEWMKISSYDFSDPNNATVTIEEWNNHFYIMKFDSGYLHTREFTVYSAKATNYYKDNFSDGNLCDLFEYSVISNELISLPDNSSYEISVNLENNIPIIKLKLNYVEFYNDYTVESGTFIPKEFIDFSRNPEIYDKTSNNVLASGNYTNITYYIKPECLN